MKDMNEKLRSIICERVYDDKNIQEISRTGGTPQTFIFDFKRVSLERPFLEAFAAAFWEAYAHLPELQIGGMESGAIPLLAAISLYAPPGKEAHYFFIRKSRKRYDLANAIEGSTVKGIPCILVDDILNRGNTLRKEVALLEEAGMTVSSLFVCVRFRDLSYYTEFTNKGISVHAVFELNDFATDLHIANIVDEDEHALFNRYKIETKAVLTDVPNRYLVAPKSAPLLVEGKLYMGVDGGKFLCLDYASKSVLWEFHVPFGDRGKYIMSSCAVYKEYVVFGAYDGNVYCLNRHSGKKKWVNLDADWVGSSPCINHEEGVVYVGLEFGLFRKHGGLIAIDIETGRVIWKYAEMEGLTHASPGYSRKNNTVVCGCNDGTFYAFDARSGKVRWTFKAGGDIKYGVMFDSTETYVTFGSFDAHIYVLAVADGSLVHAFKTSGEVYATPVFADDRHIIATSLDKRVYNFDLAVNAPQWTFETNGRIFSTPRIEHERKSVYVGSNDGILYEIALETGKCLAKIQLPDRIVNRIEVVRDREGKQELIIPTHGGTLYTAREK